MLMNRWEESRVPIWSFDSFIKFYGMNYKHTNTLGLVYIHYISSNLPLVSWLHWTRQYIPEMHVSVWDGHLRPSHPPSYDSFLDFEYSKRCHHPPAEAYQSLVPDGSMASELLLTAIAANDRVSRLALADLFEEISTSSNAEECGYMLTAVLLRCEPGDWNWNQKGWYWGKYYCRFRRNRRTYNAVDPVLHSSPRLDNHFWFTGVSLDCFRT